MARRVGDELFVLEQQLQYVGTATSPNFGQRVNVAEKIILVPVPTDITSTMETGSVHVFEYDTGASEWQRVAILSTADARTGNEFGFSAAIDGTNIVVGAPGDDSFGMATGEHAVCVYVLCCSQAWNRAVAIFSRG